MRYALVIFNPKPNSVFGVGKQCVIYGKLEKKFSQPKIFGKSAVEHLGKIELQFKAQDSKNLQHCLVFRSYHRFISIMKAMNLESALLLLEDSLFCYYQYKDVVLVHQMLYQSPQYRVSLH